MQELDEFSEGAPLHKNGSLRNADSEIKHSTSSPTKFSPSPNRSYKVSGKEKSLYGRMCVLDVLNTVSLLFFQYSPKTPPQWAEDQNCLLKMICEQVEAIKVNALIFLNCAYLIPRFLPWPLSHSFLTLFQLFLCCMTVESYCVSHASILTLAYFWNYLCVFILHKMWLFQRWRLISKPWPCSQHRGSPQWLSEFSEL